MASLVLTNGLKGQALHSAFGKGSTIYVGVKTSSSNTFEAATCKFNHSGDNNYITLDSAVSFLVDSGVTVNEVRFGGHSQSVEMDDYLIAKITLTGNDAKTFTKNDAYVISSITIYGV